MKTPLAVALFACISSLPAWAADISVTDAWARATVPGQQVSGAYMKIQADADARLLGAFSPLVPRVEVHEMKMEGDVMRMREVKAVDLPKGKTVSLQPGGLHIMLTSLHQPIAAGDMIPLILVIESGGRQQRVEVKAEARAMAAAMHPAHH